MSTKEAVLKNPGYGLFRKGIEMFNNRIIEKFPTLDKGRREFINSFIMHDLNTSIITLNFFRISVEDVIRANSVSGTEFTPETQFKIETYYRESKRGNDLVHRSHSARETILACDAWVESIKELIDHVSYFQENADIFTQKAHAVARSWGMFHHSGRFLMSAVNNDERGALRSIAKLKDIQVSVADIIAMSTKDREDMTYDVNIIPETVNGVEGIMLYNLLKNAHVHAVSRISLEYDHGRWRVVNDAKQYPDKTTLFQPGKPGIGGNTGFGLFTMKYIIGALGGYDVYLEDSESSVSFVIQAQRQAPSWSQTQ